MLRGEREVLSEEAVINVCALRVSTTSSGAGATARIAVIVQTGCGFLSGGRRDASLDERGLVRTGHSSADARH